VALQVYSCAVARGSQEARHNQTKRTPFMVGHARLLRERQMCMCIDEEKERRKEGHNNNNL
jgi:hypothetical protein